MKAFLFVVAVGAIIGYSLPSGGSAPAAQPARTSPAEAKETLVERSPLGHFYVDAEVNGELVHFVVDTGASVVALTEKDAARVGIPFSPSEFTVVGTGASGAVTGKAIEIDRIALDGKEARKVRGAILRGSEMSLLGQSYLGRLSSVEMSGDYMRLR